MDEFQNRSIDGVEDIIREVTEGQGYFCLPNVFSSDNIAHARDLIYYLIETEGKKATHFQGSDNARPDLQSRTWNLLNKGMIFEKVVQHPTILAILERILGDDFQLGSIAANTLFPGASGQEPHIDYPYWDFYERKHWPANPKVVSVPFHMNMQVTILLDDFTQQNGASGVIPFSQRKCEYPTDAATFHKNCVQTTGKAGDVVIFPGLIQHCAMPNKSNAPRCGLLLQYLPKYIRPMEDIKAALDAKVLERLSPRLRKLILLDYPYPAILDEADASNSEGSKSEFDWK
jgi:ectoine hydroxylase-related dioxygenase (phytanoyl-CoA dioxygenase family)